MPENLVNHLYFKFPKHDLGTSLIRNEFNFIQSELKLFVKSHDHLTHCVMRKICVTRLELTLSRKTLKTASSEQAFNDGVFYAACFACQGNYLD